MEETLITPSNIMFVLGLIGIVIGVYKSVHTPQDEIEKQQIRTESEIKGKANNTEALILAERVKAKNEENDRRFVDMGIRLDTAMTTAQNHIHTVDTKVDSLIVSVNQMSNRITELSTIINERMPKK